MHYHLCAGQGPGLQFWHALFSSEALLNRTFTRDDVIAQIRLSTEADSGQVLAKRSVDSSATIFLGSYTKSDALGPLGLLREDGGLYSLEEPDEVPLWALAYALSHHWTQNFSERNVTALADLWEGGAFARLFGLGEFSFKRRLRRLAAAGVLEMWQVAPPHQVTRPVACLELLPRLYEPES